MEPEGTSHPDPWVKEQHPTPGQREGTPAREHLGDSPLAFFALVFAITIPFWIFGGKPLPIPVRLPVSALAAFNPAIAASILTYRRSGRRGLKRLLSKAMDYRKTTHRVWVIPALLLNPAIATLVYVLMRRTGMDLPDPDIPILEAPAYLAVFLVFAAGEELGWMGYAIEPLQKRWGALRAALLLGLVLALFHLIPDLQNRQAADWILWQRLGSVLLRVLMVWIYNNAGKSVFAAILFHATANLSWALFPNHGSHYNPFLTALLLGPVTLIAILGWGPQTLARDRRARANPA